MNSLLANYISDVEYPEVSGVEHLQMLYNRDRLAEHEDTLTLEEQQLLEEADRRLIQEAPLFYKELSSFIDLVERRRRDNIPSSRWWWYLDVVSELPVLAFSTPHTDKAA